MICRISAAVCSPPSGVPGTRYLPIASPPMTTGSKPICRMRVDAISIACGSSPAIGTPTSSPCRCASAGSFALMFSSRHPDTLKGLVDELGPLARAGTVAEAVEFGDVVMVVVPYTALEQIGKDYGNALAKKVLVIDVSNPIARRDGAAIVDWVDEQGGAGLATAKLLPGAHIVRAFNAINYAKLPADAHRQGELVGVPIAGDDPHAIDVASSLIREIGFDPVVIGGLAMGKYLVPGTPLGGEHTASEIRRIVTNLH
jgi:8-hydroxy-5-deazaflavin:NADPH oxidoreductase